MVRRIVALCALLAGVALAAKAPVTKIVDGKEVIAGPAIQATPLIEVRDLRFYACTLASNKADCTVIVGTVLCHFPSPQYIVTIRIDMTHASKQDDGRVGIKATGTAELDSPPRGVPTKFVMLADTWWPVSRQQRDPKHEAWLPMYNISTSFKRREAVQPGHGIN